jgi:Ca2+-binding EF-hand superfamily protein
MANQFSEEQRKHILLAFNQLDKDADGKLSKEVRLMIGRKFTN